MAQKNQKAWTEGKLTWQDFSERESELNVSEFIYALSYHTGKQKSGDKVVLRQIANCSMNRTLSWINPDFRDEHYLRYNQVIFDIVETYRRKLQIELDLIAYTYEIEGKFNHIFNLCNTEIEKFRTESDGGENLESIIYWEKRVETELGLYPISVIPEFEARNFGYAMHTGLGSGLYTGSLGEHFAPSFNFIFGFDIAYKKSILFLNATLAASKVKKDFVLVEQWNKGRPTTEAIVDVSYGYAFINKDKIKLSPFVGLGILEFTSGTKDEQNQKKENKNGSRMVDYNMILGLNLDYKISTRLNLISNIGIKEKVETSIRARFYIAKANFNNKLKGYSVNLTIGLCGFGNFIRLR